MKETNPIVGTHAGLEIRLDPQTGEFYARDTQGTHWTDKTLVGLKRKIDTARRVSSRLAAQKVPAMMFLEMSRYRWDDPEDEEQDQWLQVAFRGVNAHTHAITVRVHGQKEDRTVSDPYFFRLGDPAIALVQRLAKDAREAERAKRVADQALEKALEAHAFKLKLGYGRSSTEQAAAMEEKLIDFLGKKEG